MQSNYLVDCEFHRVEGVWLCQRCLAPSKSRSEVAPRRTCLVQGLGDRISRWLGRVGLTNTRYLAARGRWRVVGGMNCVLVELPEDEPAYCGCADRQAWLNWADRQSRHLVNRLWPS